MKRFLQNDDKKNKTLTKQEWLVDIKLMDWLGFHGTLSTNWLYYAFKKYVAVKKLKLMRIKNVMCWEYTKWNQYN